ncbi:hypothetical protein R1flu_028986 [Riccia fluitans]|uniref:Glycosyltransferase 61 catalytic domain-containing protein n=1 Tax=Riccia fluitans TaxID=41844 RepID=A0ABD1XNX2_9MARC
MALAKGSGATQLSLLAGGGAAGSNRKQHRVPSITNLFLFAGIAVTIWQLSLFIGQHYYAHYAASETHHFNVTRYALQLGQALQVTQASMIENLESGNNITSALISRLEALQFQARTLDQQARNNNKELEKALQAALVRVRALEISNLENDLRKNVTGQLEERQRELESSNRELAEKLKRIEQKLEIFQDANSQLQSKISSLASSALRMHAHISKRLSENVEFYPLPELADVVDKVDGGTPALIGLPSNLTQGRLLCVQGNDTKNRTLNSYALAYREGLPVNAVLLPGTTLISDSDSGSFTDPWYSLDNLFPFLYWKIKSTCMSADRLILYQQSAVRTQLGDWIRQVFEASHLPIEVESLSYGKMPVCLENAVVSRSGMMEGFGDGQRKVIVEEARCVSRRKCAVKDRGYRQGDEVKVRLTLVAQGLGNVTEWERVLASQCRSQKGCKLSTMFVSNLTFCQQVELMSRTDILVSVHGSQLTNMIFMSPGSRVMELLPGGLEEYAGDELNTFSHLAKWAGLNHQGNWTDLTTPECPKSYKHNPKKCSSFHNGQTVGMNQTQISSWVRQVIDDFYLAQGSTLLSKADPKDLDLQSSLDNSTCACGS